MATKYRVNFSTNTGADIKWRININNVDYSGSVLLLKSQGEPITIDWPKDRNIYKPIRGSSASLNLIVEDGDTLDDFNSGGQYTWEVDLQYQLTDDTWKTYWRGWIDPVDGEESVGSFPINVSFTATDQLGLLSGSSIRDYEGRTSTSLVGYIQRALLATGLGLDLYVDSGINYTGGDALDNLNVDERVFFDEDNLDKGLDRKEVVEGILTSFNCSLFQSDGAFWVVNNSTHGGSGNTETNSFQYYEFDSEGVDHYNEGVAANVNLRKNLTSSVSTDLFQANESLYLTTQQPYGSIEAVPRELKSRNFIQNSDFTNGSEGWTTFSSSHDTTLYVDTTESINGNSIRTDRNVTKSIATNGDVWFYNNDNSTVERDYPMKISFDWAADIKNASVDNVELRYSLVAEWSDQDNVEYMSYDWYAATYGQTNQTSTVTTNRLQYNWRTNSWHPVAPNSVQAAGSDFYKAAKTSDDSVWNTHEETVKLITHIQSGIGSGATPSEQPYIYIYFYYPVLLETDGDVRSDSTTSVSVYVDNINIKSDYKSVEYEPFFERVQSNYHTTLRYEPLLMGDSESPSGYYNTLSTSSFNRNGAIEELGLEELVTQQKLNDYREQMKYYQGQLINNTTAPLGLHHKVAIEYNEYDELNDGYGSCVINGGSFRPKSNVFDATMHTPNQGSDVTSTFYREDVDLIGATPPDRLNSFTLVIQPKGVDGDGTEIKTEDSEGRDPGDDGYVDTFESLQPSVFYIPFYGDVGQRFRGSFFLDPIFGYEIDGDAYQTDSNGNKTDSDSYVDTAPSVVNLTFTDQGIRTLVEFDVSIPSGVTAETLYVESALDALTGDNITYTITKGTEPTGVDVTTLDGGNAPVNSQDFFNVYYDPSENGKEIQLSNSTLTAVAHDADDNEIEDVIGNIQERKNGVGVQYVVPVTVTNDLDDIVLTHTATTTDLADGVTTSDITLKGTQTGDDTSNWGFAGNASSIDLPITGVVGTHFNAIVEVEADSGRYITPDSISVTESEAVITNWYVVFKSHREHHVFIEGEFPGSDGNVAFQVDATTQTTDPALITGTATWTSTGGTLTNVTVTNPPTQSGLTGTTEAVIYNVAPDSGREITSAPTIGTLTDADGLVDSDDIVVAKSGLGYQVIVPFTYQEEDDSTINVPITASSVALPTGTTVTKITLTASEAGDDTDNFLIADTSLDVYGIDESTTNLIFQIEAVPGYIITGVTAGSAEESFIGTITTKQISDYEWHVYVPVTFTDSDQTGAITLNAATSDDDGEEINHTISTPDAGSNWSYVQNEDVTIGVDPGDTARIGISIEGSEGYDVSGVSFSVPDTDTWLSLDNTVDYIVDGESTTGRTFWFTVTGQPTAQTSTLTTSGSAEVSTIVVNNSGRAADVGEILAPSSIEIGSMSEKVSLPIRANGKWVVEVSGNSSTRATNTKGNSTPDGEIDVTPFNHTGGSDRTFTAQLFGSTDGTIAGKTGSQLGGTVTITQKANQWPTISTQNTTIVISSTDPPAGTGNGTITFVM